jgi:hypothetical protein
MSEIKYKIIKKIGLLSNSTSALAKVNVMREVQSAGGEELSALMPSIPDKAFKGKL